ncbi:hypothetical protein J2Q11_10975 [Tenacibaculum finnmarkense genomovar finnmarkense]|uniref:Uncharacterized protein n=3 Tax=Tenacibaculum finnmarkense TaxID=2781243 RepID=A0AAP1RGM8_9FLAO|nr:hypothetical protein [Tenacibaculum finnmarkense]MBE7653252.1 hypothetical protein [Tenacibaculum finnmarkense genomovar finnmarkense]MBE7661450.1 hypothetical protein [Tenacibaculum finnmarkense genomovar finnmarkense]MBE7695553.1 hypothetical protein [Tenacibaculum finnmarkense genomovar finnmarkense]MCD8418618.1 hypothetical protein [Tenacibaculum finnmarkense genomovar finnmarkense]MCD8427787.1 hypothetical protein [Tenacibaculum finnmarkense genomovar finnmarkense]
MSEYLKRPLEIKASAESVAKSKKENRDIINSFLNKKTRFLAKVLIDKERLWCIVIGRYDSNNANFNDTEEGEIFLGILDNEPLSEKLKFN